MDWPPANRYWAQEKPPEDGPQDDPIGASPLPGPEEKTDSMRSVLVAPQLGHFTGSLSDAKTIRSKSDPQSEQWYS